MTMLDLAGHAVDSQSATGLPRERRTGGLREANVADALAAARAFGTALGITRVTEVTRLDRIGIPVCIAIRPSALPGSLSVTAGKGAETIDARVGAWMEGIEFALFEPDAPAGRPRDLVTARVCDILAPASEISSARANRAKDDSAWEGFLSLGPYPGAALSLGTPLACAVAEEVDPQTGESATGRETLVPAELTFLPNHPAFACLPRYFVSGTTGLASGSTMREATVHGLCEILERHILAAAAMERRVPTPVRLDTLPPAVGTLAHKVHDAGLRLFLRWHANEFGLAHFEAVLVEEELPAEPASLALGFGCHPHAEIAAARAITEAAQSRLSYIHGGRDDLPELSAAFTGGGPDAASARFERFYSALLRAEAGFGGRRNPIPFAAVPDRSASAPDLARCVPVLFEALERGGLSRRAVRIALTGPDDPVQVVKLFVPGALRWNSSHPQSASVSLQPVPRLAEAVMAGEGGL